jgi:NAD(P)-dependent dehydrogenase (short-subunit alcohol dehydrogenase family)
MSTPAPQNRRSVVVTGASTGIGASCALLLDARGFQVFAGVRREEDGVALKLRASNRLTPLRLDVTEADGIAAAVEAVSAAVGERGLSGLVNNAGIAVGAPLEFVPIEDLRRQFEVNVLGVVAVTQAFLPLLRMGHGRIVNMSSISGRVSAPFFGPYSASKFALEALSDALRGELRPWGLHVAVVEPSTIATPIWEKSLAVADRLIAGLPLRAHELYGKVIPTIREQARASGSAGLPAGRVAQAVHAALTARRPRTRYLVGRGVWLAVPLIAALPDRLRDTLLARQLPPFP